MTWSALEPGSNGHNATRAAHALFYSLAQQADDPATAEMFDLFARMSLMQTNAIKDALSD